MLTRAREKPQYLDYSRHREADYQAITADELSAAATDYLSPEHAAPFVVKPVAP